MSQQKPVSKAQLAKMDGRHRSQITRACKPGGALERAVLPDGRIDLAHPDTVKWRGVRDDAPTKNEKQGDSKSSKPTKPRRKKAKKGELSASQKNAPRLDDSGFSEELADWTLQQIVNHYGTVHAYEVILDAHVKRERARKNRLENDQLEGTLIEREFVQTHVFGLIDSVLRRVLRDSPKTIALLVYSAAKREADVEEAERLVRENLSSHLRDIKSEAERLLTDE